MKWLLLVAASVIGLSTQAVVFVNHTGLQIARIEIDDHKLEGVNDKSEQILVSVSPHRHHLKILFRGGARIEWPDLDFHAVHEITFKRDRNTIYAQIQ